MLQSVKNIIVNTTYRFKNKQLFLPLSSVTIRNCSFGYHNRIYGNSILINVTLGDFSYVGGDCRLMNTTIGKFCSIGSAVWIGGFATHPLNCKSTHPGFYQKDSSFYGFNPEYSFNHAEYRRVAVGNDVWIGHRAIVLDGINVGSGAVIAAGAVVTKDVPPYAIVGGVPAKILKFRFPVDKINELLESQWWNDEKYQHNG